MCNNMLESTVCIYICICVDVVMFSNLAHTQDMCVYAVFVFRAFCILYSLDFGGVYAVEGYNGVCDVCVRLGGGGGEGNGNTNEK